MKKRLIVLLLIFCCHFSKAQTWQWARYAVTFPPLDEQITEKQHIAVDNQGNTYLLGTFDDILKWDDHAIYPDYQDEQKKIDAFIAKFDPSGNRLWSHQIKSPGRNSVGRLWIDQKGLNFIVNWKDSLQFSGSLFNDQWDAVSYYWPGEYESTLVTTDPNGKSYLFTHPLFYNVTDSRVITLEYDQPNNM